MPEGDSLARLAHRLDPVLTGRTLVGTDFRVPQLATLDLSDPDRAPLGEALLAEVDLAFVPGLAVSRDGVRLGQGGGYYDTVLPRLRELSGGAPVLIVLHDHEVVDAVPAAGHDVVVDGALTPAGLRSFTPPPAAG